MTKKGSKSKFFQNPLFEEFKGDTCYVCCEAIKDNKGICVGQGLWRHPHCKPGSRKWSGSRLETRRAKVNE